MNSQKALNPLAGSLGRRVFTVISNKANKFEQKNRVIAVSTLVFPSMVLSLLQNREASVLIPIKAKKKIIGKMFGFIPVYASQQTKKGLEKFIEQFQLEYEKNHRKPDSALKKLANAFAILFIIATLPLAILGALGVTGSMGLVGAFFVIPLVLATSLFAKKISGYFGSAIKQLHAHELNSVVLSGVAEMGFLAPIGVYFALGGQAPLAETIGTVLLTCTSNITYFIAGGIAMLANNRSISRAKYLVDEMMYRLNGAFENGKMAE